MAKLPPKISTDLKRLINFLNLKASSGLGEKSQGFDPP
jgi:hypothetical protein